MTIGLPIRIIKILIIKNNIMILLSIIMINGLPIRIIII